MIDLLHKHEYLKLEELMRLCPGTPRNKLESELKKVAEIERSGKNMNAYKLLPAYKSVCVCVLLCVVWGVCCTWAQDSLLPLFLAKRQNPFFSFVTHCFANQ